ncbi:MAG TPA: ankyrin repeat domain-containing protein, partial [Planctomycetota bacterium]|nr:ankyrin repeat domain-containing protein [Planctomycetota bacterium]
GGSFFHEAEAPEVRNDEESRAAVVRLLLDRGACRGKDEGRRSTLLRAATREARQVLLEREAASTGPVPPCYLVQAAEQGHPELVVRFLDRGPSPEAIQRAYSLVLRELGRSRAKSNDPWIDIAHLLERKGAEASQELPEAVEAGAVEVVKLLLQAGADSNRPGKDGLSPAHIAARKGSVEMLELLLDRGASVHACDPAGQTPLHAAILGRHDHCARLLLKRGANPRHRRQSPFGEETAIELAKDQGLHDLALTMENSG